MNQSSNSDTIKFLYSYGGRIVSRSTKGSDVMLRYEGGHTRVLSIDRSISFAELMVKFEGLCGHLANLKCKLPKHDLDELVSIKSDEELKAGIEEYDMGDKIRVVLFPISIKRKYLLHHLLCRDSIFPPDPTLRQDIPLLSKNQNTNAM
ncbi:unnamed protein product [Fraxinus pennsylvanica]|uniref:PB1 domain-containing protein n=1 Tax=Fraxinus pennsylvanica TaxID=56036 RepID=A0AAD1YTX2_9LAMI|nr:unnamed protein product [Fraxinus pennsylvanica]